MSNIYHIVHKLPALRQEDMYMEVEALARRLVESGRFRVDIDYNTLNFVRFLLPYERVERIFSQRELTDPQLLPETEQYISYLLQRKYPSPQARAAKTQEELERLRTLLGKYQPVRPEIEMQLARVVVQSTHPVVMMLLLWERVEVFVSYSYAIGDMLDMVSWQSQRHNSGMQSTDGSAASVFISAGGDPFGVTEKGAIYGNGLPALARMMVIGAQELGHYSDIMRDSRGRQVSRHSANFSGTRAKPHVQAARHADMRAIRELEVMLKAYGLEILFELEREIKFYKKINKKGLKCWYVKWKKKRCTKRFIRRCNQNGMGFPGRMRPVDGHLATAIAMALADMKFNLAPKADAYARADPLEEEAVACIEALARVPQQVIKWGHRVTSVMMPSLYKVYYEEVIPACIKSYENITGELYHFTFTKKPVPFWRRWVR